MREPSTDMWRREKKTEKGRTIEWHNIPAPFTFLVSSENFIESDRARDTRYVKRWTVGFPRYGFGVSVGRGASWTQWLQRAQLSVATGFDTESWNYVEGITRSLERDELYRVFAVQ